MSAPLISVVMPVYNAAEYLDAAIDSIRTQTFRDFEFIIIDDGSTDASDEILRRHARDDTRIKILTAEHGGQVAAMQLGFSAAKGAFIARADSDDISLPNRFAIQADHLFAHPHLAVVGASVELIDQNGTVFERVTHPTTPELCRQSLMRFWSCIPHSGAMIRKNIYQAVGGFRAMFAPAEDYDLWLRIAEFADIANVPYYLLQYRVHFNNLSFRKTEVQLLSVLAARRAAQLRAAGQPDPFANPRTLDWETVRESGCTNDDILECVTSFATYADWAVTLGNEKAALSLLQNLLRLVSAIKSPKTAEIAIKVADDLSSRGRLWPAGRCSLMALQACPRLSTAMHLGNKVLKGGKKARACLNVTVISSQECPQGLEQAGYVDRITPIDAFGLVIEGWSPDIGLAQLTVYTNLHVTSSTVQRNKREDVAAIMGPELLMAGFLITLYYNEPLRDGIQIDVVSVESRGLRKLTMCCETPLKEYEWSPAMLNFSGQLLRAAESRAATT